MPDPPSIATARRYLGQREVKDSATTRSLGAFVGGVLTATGIKPVAGGGICPRLAETSGEAHRSTMGLCHHLLPGRSDRASGQMDVVVGRDLVVLGGILSATGGDKGDNTSTSEPFSIHATRAQHFAKTQAGEARFTKAGL